MSEPEARSYQVVARRFRPRAFAEVVGQESVLQSLRSALQSQRIPHAFLFAGSRGVGKTTLARILARCLNCERGPTPEPCGECRLCRSILDNQNTDLIEIDAASNRGIDDIRALRERVGFATMQSRYKVYILDEVHMLTEPAFNALLKTLEEPPPNVVFVLATTELHKVPETIRSRCQTLLFRRIGEDDITARLDMICAREKVAVPDDVLQEIALQSRGGMRDAETLLERILPVARDRGGAFDLAAYRQLTQRIGVEACVDVAERLLRGEAAPALHFARDVMQGGVDPRQALGDLVEVLRWLLLLRIDGADSGLVPVHGKLRERLVALAGTVPQPRLEAAIAAGLLGRDRLRRLDDHAAVLELTLVRIAQAGVLPTLGDVLAELRAGVPSGPGAGTATAAGTVAGTAAGAVVADAAAAAAAPGTGDLKAQLSARAAQISPLYQGVVDRCTVLGPVGGRVVLTMNGATSIFLDRFQSAGVQQELRKLVHELAGTGIEVVFQADGGTAAATTPQRIATTDTAPGPKTSSLLKRVGGRVVSVNPADRVPGSGAPPAGPDDATPPADD